MIKFSNLCGHPLRMTPSLILIFTIGKVLWKYSWKVHSTLYTAAELPVFHSKIENQVILGRAYSCIYPCNTVLTGILNNGYGVFSK